LHPLRLVLDVQIIQIANNAYNLLTNANMTSITQPVKTMATLVQMIQRLTIIIAQARAAVQLIQIVSHVCSQPLIPVRGQQADALLRKSTPALLQLELAPKPSQGELLLRIQIMLTALPQPQLRLQNPRNSLRAGGLSPSWSSSLPLLCGWVLASSSTDQK